MERMPSGAGWATVPYCATSNLPFKFLVIGSAGTGKSCLLHQFIENKFKQGSEHTAGQEFGPRVVNVGGETVTLRVWAIAGQGRSGSVTWSCCRRVAGALHRCLVQLAGRLASRRRHVG